jgi:hypothetical protein
MPYQENIVLFTKLLMELLLQSTLLISSLIVQLLQLVFKYDQSFIFSWETHYVILAV